MQVDISQKHLKPTRAYSIARAKAAGPGKCSCIPGIRLLIIILPVLLLGLSAVSCRAQHSPIPNAFAHNDYWHKRPLYDALSNGYMHIEADIYLRNDELIVAHILPLFKKKKTLDQLYLKPLLETINGTNKEISCPVYSIMLMVDIKSDAEKTYLKLSELLKKYKHILTSYENGVITNRQVTVVLTGNKPYKVLPAQTTRLAFIDEDLLRSRNDTLSPGLYQTASCKYSSLITWDGNGKMPEKERIRLMKYVAIAHRNQKKVRLWASPERETVWRALLDCGVDLINTDQLSALKNFLLQEQKSYAQSTQ